MNRAWGMVFLGLALLCSCGKAENYIPEVPVNFNITIQEFNLKKVNNVVLVPNQGVKGLMIVAIGGEYVAFDRCSSVNPQEGCQVSPDESGVTATDPCTGAKFLLTDGSPQKAPAVKYLKKYRTVLLGGQMINVRN
ncbi:hypothetical protein [Pedobacter deserti]|nr:hypothetical protein [Pedobacter sp. SYSU D00382]